jgi:hypothetical protein
MSLTPEEELELLLLLKAEEALDIDWTVEKKKCSEDIFYWWERYVYTFDPRLIGTTDENGDKQSPFVRFKLFPKQIEVVDWMVNSIQRQEEGLFEKSRDVGATYVICGIFLWFWLFQPGFKGTFGSRIIDYVDKADNPDSIFMKMRIMLYRMPPELLPYGFLTKKHDNFARLVNPEIGSVITGEGGENMGRGGRSTVYALDEAAFVEQAEKIEAALSGNTNCILWISSVNGMGNLFARKRFNILQPKQIMRMHWRDDPRKTEEWAEKKKASLTNPAIWASEYDIDYSASVEGICIPALWVESCKRIAELEPRVKEYRSNYGVTGLDVGAGKAKSVQVTRKGVHVMTPVSRGDPDTTETAYWGLNGARDSGSNLLNYDAVGVGAGVSSTLNHAELAGIEVQGINVGLPPSYDRWWPDGRGSQEIFANLKAELWWLCRTAAQYTHEHVLWLEGKPEGKEHPISDLLSLPHGDRESETLCLQMSLVKWGRNERGKINIETKDALKRRGIDSPDYADALMLTFADPPKPPRPGVQGTYGYGASETTIWH